MQKVNKEITEDMRERREKVYRKFINILHDAMRTNFE